jgi:ribosomal-protein-alanine N-acetyltransferase
MGVRRARPADLSGLEEIEHASFQRERFPRSLLRTMLISSQFLTLVEEEDGAVVGYASAYLQEGGSARMVSIAVLPRWRGRGTARLLMDRLEGACREEGVTLMSLEVAVRNVVALRLYLSQGYSIKGMVKDYYGRGKDAFYMERRLDI